MVNGVFSRNPYNSRDAALRPSCLPKRLSDRALVAVLSMILGSGSIPVILAAEQALADQSTIARQLLSDVAQERYDGLESARAVPVARRGPELRAALIGLLERHNEAAQAALQRGLTLDTVENPEFMSAVQRTVAELKDPVSLPALAGALGMFSLIRPLAEFGEAAVPSVVEVVVSPSSHYSAVDDGLRVLRLVIERASPNQLSNGSRALIREAAQNRRTGEQKFTTVWYAIDLAAATGDAELRRVVRAIATDSVEVTSRGITSPRLVEQTRKRASERREVSQRCRARLADGADHRCLACRFQPARTALSVSPVPSIVSARFIARGSAASGPDSGEEQGATRNTTCVFLRFLEKELAGKSP